MFWSPLLFAALSGDQLRRPEALVEWSESEHLLPLSIWDVYVRSFQSGVYYLLRESALALVYFLLIL